MPARVPSIIPQADPGASYAAQQAEIDAAVARVLRSGRFILGEEVAAFESEFAAYLGVPHVVGVASGTDALELSLRALEIGAGQAVIAPSHTAVATIAAIERAGARPVLVDVDAETGTMTVGTLEDLLRKQAVFDGCRPAALIPVHLYGQPADLPPIIELASGRGLKVVEDCAQSHGARLGGRCTGAFGHLSAFSFYPTKNLGAFGDGGAIATGDADLAKTLRALREYGWRERFVSDLPGVNSRLDEMQAAILRVKLQRLDDDNQRRRQIAARYSKGLANTGIRLPAEVPGAQPVFHQYVIRTNDRDNLRAFLSQRGIRTAIHYPVPVHRQPAYSGRRLNPADLPVTDELCGEILSLPMYPQLADADVDRVVEAICRWASGRGSQSGDSDT